ncbi:NAD(P)/FAD-dependent oxidoreductase [Deltaproteobacteria bacterium]|nr:NAD(P)/FAD-dependent oxidoreductase [Deltaproteobacteria bacterium]
MAADYVDVLIIGAGLSGIGAACHVSKKCPQKSYRILEARESMGGTWDLFRYPGIRSDSDMFSLGYNFKPWTSAQFLADGPAILNYVKEAATEHRVNEKITYQAQVESVSWNSDDAQWTVCYRDKASGEAREIRCNFINSCTGYYNYEHGYLPEFEGRESYQGVFVHPQQWPENLSYHNKQVVVIGSGATAVTVVPEMSLDAAHVTMLQRSPTYMAAVPDEDPAVLFLRKYLPETWVYRISRTLKISGQAVFYALSRRFPNFFRKLLLGEVRKRVGPDVDMKHFSPQYKPWDERLCAVKSGDLFEAVKNGSVSIVTDHIDHFTKTGIKLKSGQELDADIVVSATGLDMKFFGGIGIVVDGEEFQPSEKLNYKGVMLEGLPNIGFTFGYTNASWTLKADLTSEWICRVLQYMDKTGVQQVVPVNDDPSVFAEDFLDFQSGYVQRAVSKFPKMGNKLPWRLLQNYGIDLMMLRYGKIADGTLQYSARR